MKQQQLAKNKKLLVINIFKRISIVTLLTGVTMLFFSCANKIEKIKEFSTGDDLPTLESDGFEMVYSDSATIRFKLKAPKLLTYDDDVDPITEFPEGIEMEKFDENMNVVSKMTPDYAQYFEKDEKWIAKNNVIVINTQGDSLKTEELIWEEAEEKLYSEQYVEIVRKDQIITGIGFQSDQDMSNWEIKNVKGQIYLDVQE